MRDARSPTSSRNLRASSAENAGSPFSSPYEAFTNYMNILADFLQRVDAEYPTSIENEELNALLKTINEQENAIADLVNQVKQLRSRKKTQ